MVMKRKLDRGLNGFQFPAIPRAPRSARRRGPSHRLMENNQNCAFELLASLAGKLLLESESSASSNASDGNEHLAFGRPILKQEQENKHMPPKAGCLDHGSSEESVFASKLVTQNNNQNSAHEGTFHDESDANMECTSNVSSSNCADKFSCDLKSVNLESKGVYGSFPCKVEEASNGCRDHCISNVENGIRRESGVEIGGTGVLNMDNSCTSKGNNANLCSSAKLTLGWDPVPSASFSRHRNNTNLGIRDDDEKFSRYKSSIKYKAFKPPSRIGDRRLRRLLTSKYWKAAPKLTDSEIPNTGKRLHNGRGWKAVCNKRKDCYSHKKYQHRSLYKKRKLSDHSSMVIFGGGFSSESVSNSPQKGVNREKNGLATGFHRVNGKSSSVTNHHSSCQPKDSHVKLSIKSFKIPELYIEVPESATVASLKRTVVEAVTALLGGGLRVGVLLQGKKVRDDGRTLLQTGITREENLDTLGFTLEPNPAQVPPPVRAEDPPLLHCDNPQPLNRSEPLPVLDSGKSDAPCGTPGLPNVGDSTDSSRETFSSHMDELAGKVITDSKALVPVTPVGAEPLAIVPVNQKTKRSELVQRRTRRPFSVAEVEALVQAVEELGTGRWRDVKLRAFENAEHRTYVDLKDKWKTLVHTATISPQQRRGEPVPQELLDRVLAAHSYWCQNQTKSHGKHQAGTLKIAEAPAERSSVAVTNLA